MEGARGPLTDARTHTQTHMDTHTHAHTHANPYRTIPQPQLHQQRFALPTALSPSPPPPPNLPPQVPRAVFLPKGASDVAIVVKHLRKHNVPLSVMGGGHSLSGTSLADGAALIRLKHMNHVHVDPKEKTAWVGAGALLADIDAEAAGETLSTAPGLRRRVEAACIACAPRSP